MVFIPRRKITKAAKKTAKSKVPRALTAVQKKEVKQLIKAPVETKYVAQYFGGTLPVTAAVNTPLNCASFLPALVQGTADHERIGDDIHPVRATGYFNYWFDSNQTTSSVDLTVHLLVLVSKVSHGFQTFSSLASNTLLSVGDGTYRDPDDADQLKMASSVNKMPINTKNWMVIAKRSFRMSKNLGQQNAESQIPASNGQYGPSSKQIKISFSKGIKKLSYLNPLDTLPSSVYPVYLTWATTTDGRAIPTGGGGPLLPVLRLGYRSELYYKDS